MTLTFEPGPFKPESSPGAQRNAQGQVVVEQPPDGPAYVYSEAIVLAVNVAMVTHRPLLLAGSPGTGKTTLAANVAHVLGWRFYPRTITSRTRARDLMWTFDTLRRLADAQASAQHGAASLRPREAYIEPQALWWAFDPASAARRGAAAGAEGVPPAADPGGQAPDARAVVLLDEIDKAEPDLPNDLLEALDTERFTIDELDPPLPVRAERDKVLMFITTNGERELPPAFLRRCIVLKLEPPGEDWLVSIANHRFGADGAALHRSLAQRLKVLRDAAQRQNLREPSTAEYLDALAACARLGIALDSPLWGLLEQSVLWKRDEALPPPTAPAG
jgi:MoxR-like ATPase